MVSAAALLKYKKKLWINDCDDVSINEKCPDVCASAASGEREGVSGEGSELQGGSGAAV